METIPGGLPVSQLGGSFLSTMHVEEDLFPATLLPQDPTKDFWFWKSIIAGNPSWGRRAFTIPVTGLEPVPENATLSVTLQSASNTDVANEHHVVVYANGIPIGEEQWGSIERRTLRFDFDTTILTEGENIIEVEGLLDSGAPYGYLYVDSFDLSYPRRYEAEAGKLLFSASSSSVVTVTEFGSPNITLLDITDPRRPSLLVDVHIEQDQGYRLSFVASAGSRYLATEASALGPAKEVRADEPSRLRHRMARAEYLVITPAELQEGADALAAYRTEQGLSSRVVRLEDIYDEFAFGLQTPLAVRDFLGYVYENWSVVPRYVVLLGKGTVAYKGGADNLLPPLLITTPHGMYASDNRLADVTGDDHLPDFQIGRIPALSNEELLLYLNKLQVFEGGGDGRDHAVLAADNIDVAGNFPADSLLLENRVPEDVSSEQINLSDLGLNEARSRLFAQLNQPLRLMNYLGHGGLDRLADEGFLMTSDVSGQLGAAPPNIVTALTCTIGRYEIPGFVSLAETLVVSEPGGAVAVWSPTGLSHHQQALVLNEKFFDSYFDHDTERLGDAITRALRELAKENPLPFMLEIYSLLGDPATRIPK
jgi:hypothetical protein